MRILAAASVAMMVAMTAGAQPQGTTADSLPAVADSATRAGPGAGPASGAPGEPRPPYKMPPFWKAATDDLHNKIVHFPIVLTLVAALVLIVARKKPELEPIAFWLVWLAALSVIAAYFSGKAQEKEFVGKPKEWLVELHEKQGIAIGVVQALWVLSLLKANTRRFAWVIGVVLSVMVLASGFLGGLLAHGRSAP